jgi:hypothetical protein
LLSYLAILIYLRNADWSSHTDGAVTPVPDATYSCTWPCAALRGTLAFTGIALTTSCCKALLCVFPRTPDMHPCRRRLCLAPLGLLWLGIVGLLSVEMVLSWPVTMPVESLLKGSAAAVYLLALAVALAWAVIWQLIAYVYGGRVSMLSRMYDIPYLVAGFSAVVCGWLLALLRESAVTASSLSRHSWVLVWEILFLNFVGSMLLAWCWNFDREQVGVRALAKVAARVLLLWIPSSCWAVVVFAVRPATLEFSECATMVNKDCARENWVLAGMLISLLGFTFEFWSWLRLAPVQDRSRCRQCMLWGGLWAWCAGLGAALWWADLTLLRKL